MTVERMSRERNMAAVERQLPKSHPNKPRRCGA